MFQRILGRGRVRTAAKRVATEPTAENYLTLAQCHASAGELADVSKVCVEGLALHPESVELERLRQRATALAREDRVRELQRELRGSPRPALWRELCEIQLEAGRLSRAEKAALEWFEATKGEEALFFRARARTNRFFADCRRDDARMALDLLGAVLRGDPGQERALRLALSIYSRCGAWNEARTTLARLLELAPGDPSLEARFRSVAAMVETSQGLDQALREVERTGTFVDDEPGEEGGDSSPNVRPLLQEIAARPGVHGAFYVRGGTALVQGQRGASAERYARGVREIVTATRSCCRRLGLGGPLEIQLEGDFGCMNIRPGAMASAAIWTEGQASLGTSEALAGLVRRDSNKSGVEA
jgi:tetratricopeptide (TPR) repeat protein